MVSAGDEEEVEDCFLVEVGAEVVPLLVVEVAVLVECVHGPDHCAVRGVGPAVVRVVASGKRLELRRQAGLGACIPG